jgi:hypothetical protein
MEPARPVFQIVPIRSVGMMVVEGVAEVVGIMPYVMLINVNVLVDI